MPFSQSADNRLRPWLERPIAHRGLHGPEVIENSASAFEAAIAAGYGVETDLQETADGAAVAFHDDALDRLTDAQGPVRRKTAAALSRILLRGGADRILPLADLLSLVGGRTPLLLEVKCDAENAARFGARVAGALDGYRGPVAVMSFEPRAVGAARVVRPGLLRGLVAMRFTAADWPKLRPGARLARTWLVSAPWTRPHFIAYDCVALPHPAPALMRIAGAPVFAWTVTSDGQASCVKRHADAIIFEGFKPDARHAMPPA
ncbi:MAG: glycerophosphodiester phosphodiesterase family protein [Hyphomicrobiales bacterium]|nr:glycerophosphodiester phosphodiesterase family protein [Hyphomicrobiales bacterium]